MALQHINGFFKTTSPSKWPTFMMLSWTNSLLKSTISIYHQNTYTKTVRDQIGNWRDGRKLIAFQDVHHMITKVIVLHVWVTLYSMPQQRDVNVTLQLSIMLLFLSLNFQLQIILFPLTLIILEVWFKSKIC